MWWNTCLSFKDYIQRGSKNWGNVFELTRTSSSPIHRPAVWITSTNWPSDLKDKIYLIVVKYLNMFRQFLKTVLKIIFVWLWWNIFIYIYLNKFFKVTWTRLCDLFCLHLWHLIFYEERDMRKNLTRLSDPSEWHCEIEVHLGQGLSLWDRKWWWF